MTQTPLFTDPRAASSASQPSSVWEEIPAPGALVCLKQGFLGPVAATKLLRRLIDVVPWRVDKIRMFGREYNLPRLQQWYGDPGQVYVWSGIEMKPLPWIPELTEVRDAVQQATRREFNSVLLNYYRDGNDKVSWHADDEPGLGVSPLIASLSLGAERDFVLRRIDNKTIKRTIALTHGSLLVMGGETQGNWEHAIPRRTRIKDPRVNLTFRMFE